MSGAAVECVWNAKASLGEGPCWDRRSNEVFWVDIKGGRLHAYNLATSTRRTWTPPHRIFSLDAPPASWTTPSAEAQWFAGCTAAGFSWIGVRDDDILLHALAHPETDKPSNRFNDGKFGPDGRYWAGTMDNGETTPSGSLYAFSESGAYDCIDAGYIVSNGPAFSPDGRAIYHTDSAQRTIYAFDLGSDGRAGERRIFMQFSEHDGYPDGMTTDRAGNLWIAMWDGARLQKISADGKRLDHITLPTARPTSCVFAGDDQRELFVTSASIGLSSSDALAGGLFRIRLA